MAFEPHLSQRLLDLHCGFDDLSLEGPLDYRTTLVHHEPTAGEDLVDVQVAVEDQDIGVQSLLYPAFP